MNPYRYWYKLLWVCLLSGVCGSTGMAQEEAGAHLSESKKQKHIFSIGAGIQHGFIFAHSPEVENTKGSNPTGVEILVGWQRNDAPVWDLCNCFPRKGFLLAYYDYDNIILGKSYTAAYFLEPAYRLGRNMFFSFKAAAGLSYLTNPYDSLRNPTNRSYSTHTSVYLLLGTGVWVRLNENWWLNGSINYQHESNGGNRQPNKGINWPTAGIALSYQKNPRPYYTGIRKRNRFWKNDPVRWDIGIMGIAKRVLDENGDSRRLPLIGLTFQGSKQVGRINALTLGTEVYMDRALALRLKLDSADASAVRAGILFGHEFLLGRFLFNQRLGVYVFNQTSYFDRIYHRWGIQFRASPRWSAGFNLLAHRHIADFIDFRIAYSFH